MPLPASRRLEFRPLTIEAIEALIAGDRNVLEMATGATFPEPLAAPPAMDHALPAMRDALRDDPASAFWGPFLLVVRETGEAAGSAGFFVQSAREGNSELGYSVYPSFQRQGIASEAAATLVAWALAQPGIRGVRATIPPGHVASQRVAANAGLHPTGHMESDPDEGPVEVWERARE
ncbi:MAG: GNAT family N-acetyltransferase [Chloroflexia bacterium]|nr:GNAT family N-acetyltransferase [Chloroflexia bacterium]